MSESAPGSEPGMRVMSPESRQVLGADGATRRLPFPVEVFSVADAAAPAPAPPGSPPGEGAGAEPDEKVAVLVCHGMGQQVPFEHIDMIAGAIRRAAGLPSGNETRVKFATLGDQRLPRAEIDLQVDGRKRRVDVYEAYWAPLTEGKVSALAVTRFLFDAGLRGIEYALRGHFDRWMMGGWHRFPLGLSTLVQLVVAFAVVCSGLLVFAALGFTVLARAGQFLFGPGVFPEPVRVLTDTLFMDLARSPLLLGLAVLPAFAGLWAWRIVSRPVALLRGVWRAAWKARARVAAQAVLGAAALAGLAWLWTSGRPVLAGVLSAAALLSLRPVGRSVASTLAALAVMGWTVASGIVLLADAAEVSFPGAGPLAGVRRSLLAWTEAALVQLSGSAARLFPAPGADAALPAGIQLLFLVSAVVVCLAIRSFYVQFLGDVAVYLSSHKLNEFDDLRAQIRGIGRDVGCAIYGARAAGSGKHEYDGVVVVGHSLGSVVAYDTLNAVLNQDMTLREQLPRGARGLEAEDRTLRLITFGSPLDKSAFIFRTQKERSQIREGLAAAVQPLIEREGGKRLIRWTNIYSPLDPISGRVDFYDPPLGGKQPPGSPEDPRRVENRRDPRASVFGHAHTAYWTNPLLADELLAAVTDELKVRR
ncbi:MAG TPA: hypothetical protein VHG51_07245 [Longimicrobiaceae bacterium]|nr:hypothetical protein [Longimicrobiaceae bacterium]